MNLIDVFIDEPIDFLKAERQKIIMMGKQIKIPVISREDLIKLKKLAGRPQDLADIDALNELERVKEEEINES
jgi:hypothetical protein